MPADRQQYPVRILKRLELRIHGLDCAEEVALLRRELGGREGVLDLTFDVVKAKMTITHDPSILSQRKIEDAIHGTGMRSEPWSPEPEVGLPFWRRHSRAILTALSGVSLMCGSAIDFTYSHLTLLEWLGSDSPPVAGTALLYAAAVAFGFGPSIPKLLGSLHARRADLSVLMAVSLFGAIFLREWSEAGTLAFLYSLAGQFETWSLRKAQSSVASLLNLSPAEATVLHQEHEHRVAVDRIKVGDIIRVRPGRAPPAPASIGGSAWCR